MQQVAEPVPNFFLPEPLIAPIEHPGSRRPSLSFLKSYILRQRIAALALGSRESTPCRPAPVPVPDPADLDLQLFERALEWGVHPPAADTCAIAPALEAGIGVFGRALAAVALERPSITRSCLVTARCAAVHDPARRRCWDEWKTKPAISVVPRSCRTGIVVAPSLIRWLAFKQLHQRFPAGGRRAPRLQSRSRSPNWSTLSQQKREGSGIVANGGSPVVNGDSPAIVAACRRTVNYFVDK